MAQPDLFLKDGERKPRGKKWRKERMAGKIIGNYVIKDRLSQGGRACVFGATGSGIERACKVVDEKYSETLWKEFNFLQRIQHPNILLAYDCIECNRVAVMATESVPDGDLHDNILRNWPMQQDIRKKWAEQILSATDYLHTNGIAHCDIKLENILVDRNQNTRLIDFGSAMNASEANFDNFGHIATTPEYLPPEIICARDMDTYDIRAIDEWSVGVVLFLMLTGRFPFGEVNLSKVAKYIKKMQTMKSFELRESEERFLYFESPYLDLIRALLNFDPEKRTTVRHLLQMPYFQKYRTIDDEIDADFEGILDGFDDEDFSDES